MAATVVAMMGCMVPVKLPELSTAASELATQAIASAADEAASQLSNERQIERTQADKSERARTMHAQRLERKLERTLARKRVRERASVDVAAVAATTTTLPPGGTAAGAVPGAAADFPAPRPPPTAASPPPESLLAVLGPGEKVKRTKGDMLARKDKKRVRRWQKSAAAKPANAHLSCEPPLFRVAPA